MKQLNRPFRALVRRTSSPVRREQLVAAGAELVEADLKAPESIAAFVSGAGTIVSTASSTLAQQEGDSIETVDLAGQLALVDAAERAGVEQFIFVSFHPIEGDFPLQHAKRAVESRLKQTRMRWTIVQSTFFQEVWLSPALGFDVAGKSARILGPGTNPIQWVSVGDVARFVVGCIDNPRAERKVVELGGREAMGQLDVVEAIQERVGAKFTVEKVPIEALITQRDSAAEPLQKSFAALSVQLARGRQVDNRVALTIVPLALGGVSDYVKTITEKKIS
jgi:uncharacterized protein YbjT (DUF2867 family)